MNALLRYSCALVFALWAAVTALGATGDLVRVLFMVAVSVTLVIADRAARGRP